MGATLEALHRLQEVEIQIAEIRSTVERKQRAVRRQRRRIADLDARIQADQNQIRNEQVEADRLDLDVKAREAEITKYRQALQAAKTNKEYSSLLTQLNTLKADGSKVEDRVLALLGQIDKRKAELESVIGERAAEAEKLSALEAEAREAEERNRDRISALEAQRDEAAAGVAPSALEVFNRIAQKNDGQALATVVRTNPKRAEYACEGCNMTVTIEQVNAILSRDDAVTCNNCGRILYVDAPAASGAR